MKLNGKNPTPVTLDQAEASLAEEIADVIGCMRLVGYDKNDTEDFIDFKMTRWAGRLGRKNGE